jgi:nitrile hydratase subunit beta
MDGIHDLGGRQGFGPIDVNEPEEAFHADWEGRVWAIRRSTQGDWSIDWWRHVRELIDPSDYITRPYFDSWAQTQLAALIECGLLTLEEATTGQAASRGRSFASKLTVSDVLKHEAKAALRFDHKVNEAPRFETGQTVRTKTLIGSAHTRLPLYARGRMGVIHANHGAHILPDLSAKGIEEAQHLYSVRFEAQELWPEAKGSRDKVFLDLWESYLDVS